jgi:hypothetical protein
MTWGNCVIYALVAYSRALLAWARAGRPRGQHPRLIVEPTPLAAWWVPRCTVSAVQDGQRVESRFAPLSRLRLRGWRVVQVLWFRGQVVQQADHGNAYSRFHGGRQESGQQRSQQP